MSIPFRPIGTGEEIDTAYGHSHDFIFTMGAGFGDGYGWGDGDGFGDGFAYGWCDYEGDGFGYATPWLNRKQIKIKMNSSLEDYVVIYHENASEPTFEPFAFTCQAENVDHAEEQCLNAYPKCEILWIVDTNNVEEAFADYYGKN